MRKSIPEEAIFLTDDPAAAVRKVTKAKTAIAGEMNEALESNFSLAFGLAPDATVVQDIERFRQLHMSGENVMGDFKKLLGSLVGDFLSDFQRRRALVTKDPSYIRDILASGLKIARENGTETLNLVNEALWRE
jgi:tryptophanyl-tRNA synthetase